MRALVADHFYDNLDPEREILAAAGIELVENRTVLPEAELCRLAHDADALIAQYTPVTGAVLAAAPRCRVVVRYGVGFDNVDLAAATRRGIPVCNVPDYGTEEVADHTWMLALAAIRKLPQAIAFTREVGAGFVPLRPIRRVRELTVGLYGFGRIARAVARRALSFGCRVITTDPYIPAEVFGYLGVHPVDRDELLARSDLLCLHTPLNDETRYLLDADAFARIKPGAILVNTARGGLVDTAALVAALDAGRLAAAALDVTEPEPLPPGHPLWDRPNVLLTPHLAWYSEEALLQLQRSVAEEVVRVLRGEPPRCCVNPGYAEHVR